jgi:hypothetical protein
MALRSPQGTSGSQTGYLRQWRLPRGVCWTEWYCWRPQMIEKRPLLSASFSRSLITRFGPLVSRIRPIALTSSAR